MTTRSRTQSHTKQVEADYLPRLLVRTRTQCQSRARILAAGAGYGQRQPALCESIQMGSQFRAHYAFELVNNLYISEIIRLNKCKCVQVGVMCIIKCTNGGRLTQRPLCAVSKQSLGDCDVGTTALPRPTSVI